MLSRRDFLKRSTLIALAPSVPGFIARTARAAEARPEARVLLVIHLDGGNDGINTVVPFADDGYARHRRVLRLPKERLLKVNDQVGLHPSLTGVARLLERGQLVIVQGVGYPNPSRSHFRSLAIWQSARLAAEDHNSFGWLGRALDDGARPAAGPASLLVGSGALPLSLRGRRSVAAAVEGLDDYALPAKLDVSNQSATAAGESDLAAFVERTTLEAYVTARQLQEIAQAGDGNRYPGSLLAQHLRLVSELLKRGVSTRIFYTRHSGYDTHATQLQTHATLLGELGGALAAFFDDLTAAGLAQRVAVLAFSEFGRTVKENGSAGTDHGTAGPVFLAGPGVQPGPAGTTPSLANLDARHGDLQIGLDFRRVYATVLEKWLALPARGAVGGDFAPLPLFRG